MFIFTGKKIKNFLNKRNLRLLLYEQKGDQDELSISPKRI